MRIRKITLFKKNGYKVTLLNRNLYEKIQKIMDSESKHLYAF